MIRANKRVTIVQRRLTDYRAPLFELLRKKLERTGIELDLVIGRGTRAELRRGDESILEWAKYIDTRYAFEDKISWMPIHGLRSRDLLIVTQENSQISNHLVVLGPRKGRVAFWGHGANLQSASSHGLSERYKAWLATRVDWWFAYTELSKSIVSRTGFPKERITCLNNSIDISSQREVSAKVTRSELRLVRRVHSLSEGYTAGFVGSIHGIKKVDLVIEIARRTHDICPEFKLLIVGSGEEEESLVESIKFMPWIEFIGRKNGFEKALYMQAMDFLIMPAGLGLVILDSFCFGVPIVTMAGLLHGPEFSYLENNRNCLITGNDIDAYVAEVINLMKNRPALTRLKGECLSSSKKYSIERMSEEFSSGIQLALETPRRAGLFS